MNELQTLFQSEDYIYVTNTLIAIIFILSMFKAIQSISKFKSSGSNPAKRTDALNGIKMTAIFFFIDGILISVNLANFITDIILKASIYQTDSVMASNELFKLLGFVLRLSAGATFLSIISSLIAGFVFLASRSSNPKLRLDAMKGIFYSLIASALLGSISIFAAVFIRVGIIGGA